MLPSSVGVEIYTMSPAREMRPHNPHPNGFDPVGRTDPANSKTEPKCYIIRIIAQVLTRSHRTMDYRERMITVVKKPVAPGGIC